MNVSKEKITSQINRLMGKAFPPENVDALRELVSTLQKHTEDDAHLERIISHLLSVPGPFPEIAVFLQAADQTATLVLMADPLCKRCSGVGQISIVRGGMRVTHKCKCSDAENCIVCHGTKQYQIIHGGMSYAERCNCWARRPKSTRPWAMGEGAYGE